MMRNAAASVVAEVPTPWVGDNPTNHPSISTMWRYDPATNILTPTWVNPDGGTLPLLRCCFLRVKLTWLIAEIVTLYGCANNISTQDIVVSEAAAGLGGRTPVVRTRERARTPVFPDG